MQLPIALAEFPGGIFLIVGVITRISGSIFPIILLGAIFHIRWENGFFVSRGGWEWDLVMLASALAIIVVGQEEYLLLVESRKFQNTCSNVLN